MQKRVTILVTDSQPFFRAGVRQALSQRNIRHTFNIIECDPGDQGNGAIEQIASKSPDVVLLDICYPSLTGLELGKKIVRFFPATKVVMLSSNPDENDEELFEAIKTGAVAYLSSKHCTPTELIETIKRASRGEYPINDTMENRPKVAWRVLRQFQEIASSKVNAISTPLTSREIEILNYLAEGNSNKHIASLMGISEQTIKNHVSSILRKLDANDRAHAVFLGLRLRLIPLQEIASSKETINAITAPLTSREIQILNYIAGGNTNDRIASLLGISIEAVKNHITSILDKLAATGREHAVLLGVQMGLIPKQ